MHYKKITVINQSTGYLTIDMINHFASIYEEVVLITGSIQFNNSKLNEDVKVVYKMKYRRNNPFLRIFTWLYFHFQTFLYLFLNLKKGKLFLVTNPPTITFIGPFFLKYRKLKYDILVYDIYPEALSNFGYLNKTSFLYKLWSNQNKKSYKMADKIFTISSVMKDVLSNVVSSDKIDVVYPWVDTKFIKPMNKDENWFIKKYSLIGKKVVLYSGNMGLTHDLITILDVAKELDEDVFHFLFIGDGAQKKKLQAYAIEKKLNNVTFLPYQDEDVLPYSFASADYSIVSLGRGAEGLSVPSKSFYYLAVGSAILSISEKGSEIEKLVQEFDLGVTVIPGDILKLKIFLKDTSDVQLEKYKSNSRELSKKFTIENAEKFI